MVFRTGQVLCYDGAGREIPCAGSGQDGEHRQGIPWPVPRFRESNGAVDDLLTGLTWSQDANPAVYPISWEEALDFIRDMRARRHLGHGDWRMPGRRELRSLLSHQETRPPLPGGHPFVNIFQGWYWTSTPSAANNRYVWYVHLGGGRTFCGAKSSSYLLWPVRGEVLPRPAPPRADRFSAEGETVTDRATGLLWRRRADVAGEPVTWDEALRAVKDLNDREGTRRWRLPNVNELESLTDLRRFGPALPEGHPFLGVAEEYWSSTTSTYEPDWAWALYLHKGAVGVGRKSFARFRVWAVGS